MVAAFSNARVLRVFHRPFRIGTCQPAQSKPLITSKTLGKAPERELGDLHVTRSTSSTPFPVGARYIVPSSFRMNRSNSLTSTPFQSMHLLS